MYSVSCRSFCFVVWRAAQVPEEDVGHVRGAGLLDRVPASRAREQRASLVQLDAAGLLRVRSQVRAFRTSPLA